MLREWCSLLGVNDCFFGVTGPQACALVAQEGKAAEVIRMDLAQWKPEIMTGHLLPCTKETTTRDSCEV